MMAVQQVRSPGGATEALQSDIIATLALVLAELEDKLEAGQAVALDAATLAALESVTATIANWPEEFPLPDAQVQTDALTDDELRATPVPVSGVVTIDEPVTVEGTQTDALTDAELRAADVDTADSGEREYLHVVETVTAVGNTVVYTPAAGMRIRLRWIYAINDPASDTVPLIKVLLGAEEKYRVYALSKRQKVTGPVDGALTINLSGAGSVAVTALLEEV